MPNRSLLLRCRSCGTLNRIPADKIDSHPVCGQCKTALVFPHEPINVTETSYEQQVQSWPETVVAEFWARWCGYCRIVEPYLSVLAGRHRGRLKIIKVDVDAEQALARRFTVKATPTFILYRNGRQIARFDGAPVRNEDLEMWILREEERDARQA